MKIGDFVRTLQAIGLQPDLLDLRDMLWLAQQITVEPGTAPAAAATRNGGPLMTGRDSMQAQAATGGAEARFKSLAGTGESDGAPSALYASGSSGDADGGAARRVQLRGAPALPDALAIGRALRPLSRRRSGNRIELDERATAEFIADTGLRTAVWRPAFERWFDIVVAIDEVPSLAAWRPMVAEFERLLRRQGGFRAVTTVFLRASSSGIAAFSKDAHKLSASALQDRNGRRIVLVASDCTSSAWRGGAMGKWLKAVAESAPVAVVQLLPQALWPNTATGFAELRTKSPRVGTPGAQLHVRLPSWAHGGPGVVVPVLALEPAAVAAWARMTTAGGNAWGTAALFPLPDGEDPVAGQDQAADGDVIGPARRAASFRASATPDAQRLAAYFSVVRPLTPPVMRVIHQAMAPASGAVALAQVFLGGLLHPVHTAIANAPPIAEDEMEYDFHPGLRDRLSDALTPRDFVQVNLALHEFLQQCTGTAFDFFALLEDPGGSARLPAAAMPFAQSARAFARRFTQEGAPSEPPPLTKDQSVAQLAISLNGATLTFVYRTTQGQLTLRHNLPQAATVLLDKVLTCALDEDVHTLAKLVVPAGLQDTNAIVNGPDFVELRTDMQTEPFPWEALIHSEHTAASTLPLAVARGLTRRASVADTRVPDASPRARYALVIGDPLADIPTLQQLPGARREAGRVAALLSKALQPDGVRTLIAKGAQEILNALFERDLRVLHIASHSVLEPSDGPNNVPTSGIERRVQIVLDAQTRLGLNEFHAMKRVPELVFLGVHHGAAMGPSLLAMGSKVVVAPIGLIDDEAATIFAIAFFESLTKGAALIEALRDARQHCWRTQPSNEIWGRFQCFGDADWRLVGDMAQFPEMPAPSEAGLRPEQKKRPEIFVSYARDDHASPLPNDGFEGWVTVLASKLRDTLEVFVDSSSIGSGDNWADALSARIDRCDGMIIVLSRAYLRSEWCRREFEQFLAHRPGRRYVIVEIEPVDATVLHPELGDLPKIRFWQDQGGGHRPSRVEPSDPVFVRRINELRHAFDAPEAAMAADTPSTDSPRAWVLVAGTGRKNKLSAKLAQTCDALGTSLAKAGYGVITGGWPGVDEAVARGFAQATPGGPNALESRLVHVVGTGEKSAFPLGGVVEVTPGEAEYDEAIGRAALVVLVGGAGGTLEIAHRAQRAGRAVLPLADTGGDARKYHRQMMSEPVPGGLAGVGAADLAALAQPAPQVVAEAVAIIERLVAHRPQT